MSKVDKEYVDAQIASIEEKVEARINDAVGQVNNQDVNVEDSQGDFPFPVGFLRRKGEVVYYMNDDAVRTIAWKLLLMFNDAKIKLIKKQKEEGKKPQEEWYADVYNKNVENWKLITDLFRDYLGKLNNVQKEVQSLSKTVAAIQTDIASLKKSAESVVKTCKPTGVYICGKHIAGCYFFSFMRYKRYFFIFFHKKFFIIFYILN